jgi:hypothetical protein
MRSQLMKSVCIALAGVLFVPLAARASVSLTVDAPGVESSQVGGVVTETFNTVSIGKYTTLDTPIGDFTAPTPGMAIVAANEFGGAGGTGNYMAIGAESGQAEADLALNSPASYLGVWLSALDANNIIEVYSGSSLLATFNYSNIKPLETASGYYGNPNSAFLGQDSGEPFAYLNITGTAGTTFDKIVFLNSGQNTGEELDNISVLCAASPSAGPLVPLPAAGWTGLGMLACLAAVGMFRRRGTLMA